MDFVAGPDISMDETLNVSDLRRLITKKNSANNEETMRHSVSRSA
jgi:hypothetical protein